MSLRRVLVTGAGGLIGAAVTQALLGRGIRVLGWDTKPAPWNGPGDPRLSWEMSDITSGRFPALLADHGIDGVVHAAAHPGGKSLAEPAESVRTNAFGSMCVFEACARAAVPVVFLSSSVIYGDQPPSPIPETAPVKPGTIYGVSKVACEQYLRILQEGFGLRWTVVRLFSTYGAGHRPSAFQGIVNVFLSQLEKGNEVVSKGALSRVRDLIYVEDAATAIVSVLDNEATRGRILNVGTGVGLCLTDLIRKVAEALGKDPAAVVIKEEPGTVGDPAYNVADIRTLRSLTGFQPAFDLAAGLKDLVLSRRRLSVSPGSA